MSTSSDASTSDEHDGETAEPDADAPKKPSLRLERRTRDAMVDARAVLDGEGFGDDADAVMARLRAAIGREHSIVVVGEVGRGKSTIVNALLGDPDASPVGVGETTGAYVRFQPPSEQLAEGVAMLEFADATRTPVERARVRDWVSVGGARVAQAGEQVEPPVGAVVAVDATRLPGVAIVDTPGTGGLDPDHAKLAIARAESASVLLLVTDAGGRISRPALEFLSRCADHVGGVVVAMSKIDKNPRAWRRILDENRTVLREWDARFADVPIVAVSGYRACEALELPAGAERDRAAEASRLDDLVAALEGLLSQGDRLIVANALTQFRALLARATADVAALEAASGGGAAPLDLEAQKRRLAELTEVQQRWRLEFERDFGDLRSAVIAEAQRRAEALQGAWDSAIADRRWGVSGSRAQAMRVDICAQVAGIEADLRVGIRNRIAHLAAGMFARARLRPTGRPLALGAVPMHQGERANTMRDARADLDLGLLMPSFLGVNLGATLGTTAGSGLSAIVAASAAATVMGAAAITGGILGGVAMVGVGYALRSVQKQKQNLRAWLQQTIANLRADLAESFNAHFRAVKPEIVFAFERALEREATMLKNELQAAARDARATEHERAATLAALGKRRAALTGLVSRIEAELVRVRPSGLEEVEPSADAGADAD